MVRRHLIAIVAFGFATAQAAAPPRASAQMAATADCSHWHNAASTQAVLNLCSTDELRKTERLLVERFATVYAALDAPGRAALDATQHQWVLYRDAYCTEKTTAASNGSMRLLTGNLCRTTLDRRRIDDLQSEIP